MHNIKAANTSLAGTKNNKKQAVEGIITSFADRTGQKVRRSVRKCIKRQNCTPGIMRFSLKTDGMDASMVGGGTGKDRWKKKKKKEGKGMYNV